MTDHPVERAEHSIHHVHALIHRVFTDADGTGAASIEPLMQAFADDFSMVGVSAIAMSRSEVEQLFRGAVGARPGLEILISHLHTIWYQGETLAVSYVETHRLDGIEQSRASVAILCVQPADVQWRYLHEIPLSTGV
ncbi:DUF4440 domain-containing protein [Pseudomonas sp. SWRI153]|uniref:DUF4440 domain-containing protein n=1 Tax=Pseudomonas khorasanensis TaxID=2745508 RepID=A0A923F2I4_9PSED|nr:DUF4440 domain-containing protein [Pseudomonas khorasanensis]MBV4485318.1 DUF4440 domain-containing protein [Pseudomonas khorasanensis]